MLGHENIFALGDVVDLPMQRSLVANHHQIRVVVHNALNYLKAQTMTGTYNLETELPLYTGIAKFNTYKSVGGKETLGAENPLKDGLMYFVKCNIGGKGQTKLYKGKKSAVSKAYELQNRFAKSEMTGAEPKI